MRISTVVILLAVFTIHTLVVAQSADKKKTIRRAKPPTFSEKDTKRVFYDNVFEEGLVGERPANLSQVVVSTSPGGQPNTGGGGAAGALHAWKDIIDAEVIEDEVKRISMSLDTIVTTPTKFRGGGYKKARKQFSIAAMLFAIAGEYDGDVRWKKDAPELRDLFARAAGGSKVGSQQAYDQAKSVKTQLQELVRGSTFNSIKPGEVKAEWPMVCDRSPLMIRLEVAFGEVIKPALANENEFKENKDDLMREASIVAAISETLMQEDMEEFDEEDYVVHAKKMKQGALDILDGIKVDNYETANKGAGMIDQACSQCHSDWR